MARKRKPPELLGGPYAMPPSEVGSSPTCRIRGRVKVQGLSAAPVPWPWSYVNDRGLRPLPVVTGDLERAIRTESNQAVA